MRSIPSKRSFSDLVPSPHVPPKRLRFGSRKNIFSAHKVKERGRQSPSQDHTLCASGHLFRATDSSSSVHSPVLQASRRIATASRPFAYNYKDHSDLEDVKQRYWDTQRVHQAGRRFGDILGVSLSSTFPWRKT
jgi:hypothetical protein